MKYKSIVVTIGDTTERLEVGAEMDPDSMLGRGAVKGIASTPYGGVTVTFSASRPIHVGWGYIASHEVAQ